MAEELKQVDEEVKLDFGVLFEGSELSDEIKDKVKLIFESALADKVASEVKVIQEEYEAKFDNQLDEIKQELVEQIDTFLNYAVEEWVKENQVAIESGLRTEITEGFITGLKNLFAENYIEVPEEKYELVSEMEAETAELKVTLDEQIAKNIALSTTIAGLIKESVIAEVGKDLAATDMEKLKSHAESIVFESEESFKEKVVTLKENFFPKTPAPKSEQHLDESVGSTETIVTDATVKAYADAIARMKFN